MIAALIPYTDSRLLNENSDVAMSPFTIIFDNLGILFAASIMNTVILTAVLSAGNSGLYATSRLLYSLSNDRQAPQFLGRLNKRNMPFNALITTTVLIILSIIYAHLNMGGYGKLLNMLGTLVLIVWFISIISHYRLRRAIKVQNLDEDELLTYKAPFFPIGVFLVSVAILFLLIGQSFADITSLNWSSLTDSILPIILALAAYFGYKGVKKTKVVKLQDIDLTKHEL